LIRKVWAADPLACPKCGGRLRIISFIEDAAIAEIVDCGSPVIFESSV
jgi:hypothetical protein